MEDDPMHARTRTSRWFASMMMVLFFLTTGCLGKDPQEAMSTNPQLLEGARDQSLGPDICRIQEWAALAMAKTNGRTPEQANYDRVAWNLAQYQVSTLLDKYPNMTQDQAVAETAKALDVIYKSKTPGQCPVANKLSKK